MKYIIPYFILRLSAFFLIFLFFSSGPAAANEQPVSYGLAMHDEPRYGADITHLDYANPDAPKGGRLRQAVIGSFDSLNPYAIRGRAAQGLNLVFDRLMQRVWDEPFTMYPLIAARVDIPEDRSAMTVHINPAARFHDGSPVTAADVLFSFETLRDHGRPNMRRIYQLVSSAEILDERRVHFQLGPGYDRETVMILAMMPVLSKAWWEERRFDSSTLTPPLSNGPYKIKTVDPGRRIVLERVDDYWAADLPVNKGHYNFDEVIFDYYRDDTVAFEAFKTGAIDVRREFDAGKWATSYDFPALRRGEVVAETLPHGRPERVRSLIFNTRRAPFDDISVRKALNHALDFNWINTNLFHGQYQRVTSYFPNSELAATGEPSERERALLAPFMDDLPPDVLGPAWQPPSADNQTALRAMLRTADELLKEAGWIIRDGRRVHKESGQAFDFEILLENPEDEKIALAFINSLRRLGIEARARVMDSSAFRGRLNEYDFDMTIYFWQNSLSPGTEQMLYWSCEAAQQPARWNHPGICHPAIDALSAAMADAQDRADLVAHARALDRLLSWGYYIIPLYYAGQDYVARRSPIKRPNETPLYGMVIESWWHEPDVQE